MSTFVLVHGGWHGAWCWERVAPLLAAAGHTVVAPDLPGHGRDPTPIASVAPGADVAHVCKVLDGLVEPAILVGHSSGGMVITECARQRPLAVRALVYLAAFLLPPGVTPPEVMRDDAESLLLQALVVDRERRTVSVRADAAKDVFYGDCSDADAAWASAQLGPDPLRPASAEVMSDVGMPAQPRFYVETLRDRALGPTTQRRMQASLPCRKVYALASGHSPFLSMPHALAGCLLDILSSC